MPTLLISAKKKTFHPLQRFLVWSRRANRTLGEKVEQAQEHWLARQLSQRLGVNWLLDLIYRVDTVRITADVQRLRAKFPQATARELSQHLIKDKLLSIGGVGFVAGLVPLGVNIPFLALDVVTSLRLQCELVYGIAAVYGLDLTDTQRKGELLWVLALGFGSEKVILSSVEYVEKTALPLITPWLLEQLAKRLSTQIAEKFVTRWIPLVGAFLGAGANIALLHLVGRAAMGFYEQHQVLEV